MHVCFCFEFCLDHLNQQTSMDLAKFYKGKNKSGEQAFSQGSLDGLCGLYSVINAFKCLFPKKPGTLHSD